MTFDSEERKGKMQDETTKPCRMCCQPIPERARKCPHCHHLQTATQAFFHNPGAQVLMGAGVALLGLVIFVVVMSNVFDHRGREFSDFKSSLKVVDTSTAFSTTKQQDVVVVVGAIENGSDVSWTWPQIEVVFKDASGKVTDAHQVQGPRLVLRKDRTAFSVTVPRLFPEDKYVSHEVKLLDASEARRGFVD